MRRHYGGKVSGGVHLVPDKVFPGSTVTATDELLGITRVDVEREGPDTGAPLAEREEQLAGPLAEPPEVDARHAPQRHGLIHDGTPVDDVGRGHGLPPARITDARLRGLQDAY